MPRLPHNPNPNDPKSLDIFEANASDREINHITKRLVASKRAFGNVTGRKVIICDGGKSRFYPHPNADINERLEHYKNIYPDAKMK